MEKELEYRFRKLQPAVIGVFREQSQIKKILSELHSRNFSDQQIKLLKANSSELHQFDMQKEILIGAHIGALAGLIVGVVSCVLASYNIIHLPGQQTWIQVGAFLSAVAGGSIGVNAGAFAGIIVGYLVTKSEHRRLEHYLSKRGIVISVHVEEPKQQLVAKNVLVSNGAVKIYNPVMANSDGKYVFNKSKIAGPIPM